MRGSRQVSGDAPTLPWVRSRVWLGVGLSSKGGVGGYVPRNLNCSNNLG